MCRYSTSDEMAIASFRRVAPGVVCEHTDRREPGSVVLAPGRSWLSGEIEVARRSVLMGALIFAALIVGAQYVVWWDYDPKGMSAAFYTEKMQHAIRVIGLPLFSLQIATALLTMISAFLARRDRPRFFWLLAASALCIVGVLLTAFGNIPILNQIATWNIGAPPSNWLELADKWWWFHTVRIGVQIAALAFLACLIFVDRPSAN
jgi:Domain of unknown function (DUF1772)